MTSERRFATSTEVNRAAGMIAGQAHCLIEEALAMIRERAIASNVTMQEIAEAVLDGAIRFGKRVGP